MSDKNKGGRQICTIYIYTYKGRSTNYSHIQYTNTIKVGLLVYNAIKEKENFGTNNH